MVDDNYLYVSGSTTDTPFLSLKVVEGFLSADNEITCYPTLIGYTSKALVELANTSSFHYRFSLEPELNLTSEDQWEAITPELRGGYIGPYERLAISWNFLPREEVMYNVYWRFSFDVVQTVDVSESVINLIDHNYEFIMPLAGAGETPRLMTEPKNLDLELVPIYETKTSSFKIINAGSATIEAELSIYHESWLKDYPKKLIKIEPTSIKLEKSQSVDISVTVRPSRVNMQNFFVVYEVTNEGKVPKPDPALEEMDGEGESEVDGRSDDFDFTYQHLTNITFVGDHAIFNVTDILLLSRHPIWDSQQCWHMFSLDLLNQCLIPYHHTAKEGALPRQVSTVNFRFPPAPVNSETSVFQLHLSNIMDWPQHFKGHWTIWTAPPKNWRSFVADKNFKYKSAGRKTTLHNGHVKDDPDMLAILWARKIESNNNELRSKSRDEMTSTIEYSSQFDDEEQKCRTNAKRDTVLFEISPVSGQLKGKESQIITFKYKYERPGFNKMSILLRVYPAIFLWIDLSAQTLEPDEPFLQLMENKLFKFHTISLADLDPPLQMLWMYNGGNVPTGFGVEMEPFEKLKKENFNHAVIDCVTSSGVVPPKSWFPIKLRFSPLEYTEYTVPLIIKPDYNESTMEVTLKGSTVMTAAARLRPDAHTSGVRTFVLYDNSLPVTLSPSEITFHHFVPTGHKTTSTVFLTNLHNQNIMLFRWPDVPVDGGGSIRFQPKCGRIQPGEAVACQVIVEAGNMAVTFSTMIRCMLEDESDKAMYHFALDQWRQDQSRSELDITDSVNPLGVRARLPGCPKPVAPKSFSHLLSISVYIGSVFGLYDLITSKERSRMSHFEPITANRPIPTDPDIHSGIILTKFERELSEEIISSILLDIFSTTGFESYVRNLTKRLAPLYEDYKESEIKREEEEEFNAQAPELPPKFTEEIVEAAVFNLMQELNTNYVDPQTRDKWYDLEPVQPAAFVNVDEQNNEMNRGPQD